MMGLKFILEKSFDLISKLFRTQENFENAQKNEALMNITAYIELAEANRINEEFRRVRQRELDELEESRKRMEEEKRQLHEEKAENERKLKNDRIRMNQEFELKRMKMNNEMKDKEEKMKIDREMEKQEAANERKA